MRAWLPVAHIAQDGLCVTARHGAGAEPTARWPTSGFTCPECSGALWELREGELIRYRCRVGHAYSEDAMVEAQGSAVEAALWTALEVLEERGELLRRIAVRMDQQPRTSAASATARASPTSAPP